MRLAELCKKNIIVIITILVLASVYIFQQQLDWANFLNLTQWPHRLIVNKSIRFLINDLLVILLIKILFVKNQYVWFAFLVQLFGIIFILTPYLIMKIYFPGEFGIVFSFLHRLVVNPLLMLMLLPAFYFMTRNPNN
jgi:exosortase F-associated protein